MEMIEFNATGEPILISESKAETAKVNQMALIGSSQLGETSKLNVSYIFMATPLTK
jgi:hypothetical protein